MITTQIIQNSVGRQGINNAPDVACIAELLGQIPPHQGGPGTPNLFKGRYRLGTIFDAIEYFYFIQFGIRASVTIDPDSETWQRLVAVASGESFPDCVDNKKTLPVEITVSNVEAGICLLVPYSHANHCNSSYVYRVPLYWMSVTGVNHRCVEEVTWFRVVRFGIQDYGRGNHAVVGLADAQTHTVTRHHSNKKWTVYGSFLIHSGSPAPETQPWGAIGCVEVTGTSPTTGRHMWYDFEDLILKLSGANTAQEVSDGGNLTATYQKATRPPLVLR